LFRPGLGSFDPPCHNPGIFVTRADLVSSSLERMINKEKYWAGGKNHKVVDGLFSKVFAKSSKYYDPAFAFTMEEDLSTATMT
jgi:hypothetical protein